MSDEGHNYFFGSHPEMPWKRKENKMDKTYLGDGVMAGFDGYHIRLWLDGETEDAPIYLDIYTAEAMRDYINKIFFDVTEE